jgi:hypothetical protein
MDRSVAGCDDPALEAHELKHRSVVARALVLAASLLSSFTSSIGVIACTEPGRGIAFELVPAGSSGCVDCESDACGASAPKSGPSEPGFAARDSCDCSDVVVSDGRSIARVPSASSLPQAPAVGADALPPHPMARFVAPEARLVDRRFVPPRPDPGSARVRATVRLI